MFHISEGGEEYMYFSIYTSQYNASTFRLELTYIRETQSVILKQC